MTTAPLDDQNGGARDIFVFKEDISPGLKYEMQLKRVFPELKVNIRILTWLRAASEKYVSRKNAVSFQIALVSTVPHKTFQTLITDGLTQSTEFDEFCYHESLVHPSLIKCAQVRPPETVFIGGGGELATAREVLRHQTVKKLIMVDLDEKVVEVSKQYLPEWGGDNVCNDPRFELVIGDAHEYIHNTEFIFDVIIMDISDPVEAGPGIALYTREFYDFASSKINPGGVFVTQAGMASAVPATVSDLDSVEDTMSFGPIVNTLGSVFDVSLGYTTNIPSFGSDWGFVMAYNTQQQSREIDASTWQTPPAEAIDSLLKTQLGDELDSLKHYDGLTHCRMFALPKPLRTYVKADKRIMTKSNPIFMYSG
eukprot:CAMPEP_0168783818 /NCGR_PEP_ID=MMETSP0725-20121227/9894_1 /TAXON_ID=265536 /ORGANISM="Amphiprora sp., Strain CCMP467" /LENGTH=366 /DNA_ID=CAMNT_0008833831 /DNA_START=33 /DNA_END=1134 /DNA_ORIENTATION=-